MLEPDDFVKLNFNIDTENNLKVESLRNLIQSFAIKVAFKLHSEEPTQNITLFLHLTNKLN